MNTMGQILRNWRITLAVFFSIIIIVGSFLLTRNIESPPVAQASAESALLQAIATKDSNGDGLPDWEKVLYGIPVNSTTTDYFHLGMTDGEAVAKGLIVPKAIADIPVATSSSPGSAGPDGLPSPAAEGTLTAAFTQKFFSLYLSAKQANGGAALSASDTANIASEAIGALSSTISAAPDFKSAKDLTVSGSGADALKTFAANAEAVMRKNAASGTTTEITYFEDAMENNDMSAFPHLAAIAKANRDSAVGLAMLPVPAELVSDDLFLINSLMRLSEIINDFAHADTDPLTAMLALQQYLQTTQDLWRAFANIGATYAAAGVVLPAGAPGASFVNLIANLTAQSTTQIP
ncbi:hypothetical protein HKL94_00240 [Candidatus Parcubacteria bacterium]|nr:hypothetical protein [Candidatus Parcubacteria bacterium]